MGYFFPAFVLPLLLALGFTLATVDFFGSTFLIGL
jgi:hypothetical protein